MTDRLNDLRKATGTEENGYHGGPMGGSGYAPVPKGAPIPAGGQGGSSGGGPNLEEQQTFMNDFFQCVEMIKSNILAIQNATKRVGEIRENVVLATMAEKEAAYSAELNPLLTETNKKATFVKNMLKR